MNLPLLIVTAELVCAGLLLTGCTHGARTPVNASKYDLENTEPFVLLGRTVQRSITCSGIMKHTTSDGRLRVAANVRNRQERSLHVQIGCEFKDESGRVVDSVPFRSLFLSPLSQEAVEFVAMNAGTKSFTIRVRETQ